MQYMTSAEIREAFYITLNLNLRNIHVWQVVRLYLVTTLVYYLPLVWSSLKEVFLG